MAKGKGKGRRLPPKSKTMLASGGRTAEYHREPGEHMRDEPMGRALKSGRQPAGKSSGGKRGR
jgi:hypothetical protein